MEGPGPESLEPFGSRFLALRSLLILLTAESFSRVRAELAGEVEGEVVGLS